MGYELPSARLKFRRAQHHASDLLAKTLEYEASAVIRSVRNTIVVGQRKMTVHPILPGPEEIPLLFGDLVHNLRSALDHVAWQLACEATVVAGRAPARRTAMPICTTEDGRHGFIAQAKDLLRDVPEHAVAVIRGVQPFSAPHQSPVDHPLRVLHELWQIDKHRELQATLTLVSDASASDEGEVDPSEDAVPPRTQILFFDPEGPADGWSVGGLTRFLIDGTEQTLSYLEEHLPR